MMDILLTRGGQHSKCKNTAEREMEKKSRRCLWGLSGTHLNGASSRQQHQLMVPRTDGKLVQQSNIPDLRRQSVPLGIQRGISPYQLPS